MLGDMTDCGYQKSTKNQTYYVLNKDVLFNF